MTLDQAWPSYFLSMPCICDKDRLMGNKGGILNRMSWVEKKQLVL